MITNIFANNQKLHKFATTNTNFKKNWLFPTCIIVDRTCLSIFIKIWLVARSVKTVHTNVFANNRKLHKFATCNTYLKKLLLSDTNHPISHIYANFKINRLCRSVRTASQRYFYRGRTDGQTDGRTNIARDDIR